MRPCIRPVAEGCRNGWWPLPRPCFPLRWCFCAICRALVWFGLGTIYSGCSGGNLNVLVVVSREFGVVMLTLSDGWFSPGPLKMTEMRTKSRVSRRNHIQLLCYACFCGSCTLGYLLIPEYVFLDAKCRSRNCNVGVDLYLFLRCCENYLRVTILMYQPDNIPTRLKHTRRIQCKWFQSVGMRMWCVVCSAALCGSP